MVGPSVKGQQDVGTQVDSLFGLFAIICADPANAANICKPFMNAQIVAAMQILLSKDHD